MTKKTADDAAARAPGARRGFLKVLGLSAGAAAAATPLIATPAVARESRDEARKARYKPNSPEVQAFYRTNRYEH
ncbi:hypothetical protein [Elioraea sp.]|uniref:hypothetical protein n=1 Tax=Elioraea sp. TaxID=2185103 RepID=UPI0025BB60FA|nr:hypothetical protein [Elioraea sp.]